MVTLDKISLVKEKLNSDLTKAKTWQNEKVEFLNRYIQNKQKYIMIATLTGFIVVGTTIGIFHYLGNKRPIYNVYLDGENIGTVNNKGMIGVWQSQLLRKAQISYGPFDFVVKNNIAYEEEIIYKGKYDNSATLKKLSNKIKIEAKAVEIIIDGKPVGTVKNQFTAQNIVNKIVEAHIPKTDKNQVTIASISQNPRSGLQVKEVQIKEDITYKEVRVQPNNIVDEETMLTLLQKGTLKQKVYEVKKGDTISEIALQHGLTTKEMYRLNPELKSDLINIGDKLVVTATKPLITVYTQELVSQIEKIPPKVIYKYDNTMYMNESKILSDGKQGQKEVHYYLIKENGITIEKKLITEKVLEQPIKKLILKGTKIIPSRGTGVLNWPADGGIITSYFGTRWGSFHEAIDIARPNTLTITAADNGIVTYVGWKNGYGKVVELDHGNGMVTLYAHLSSMSVVKGDKIAKGQPIGIMGSTGRSTGTHLHFEVIVDGVAKNPLNYLGI